MKRFLERFGGIFTMISELGVGVVLFIRPDDFTGFVAMSLGVLVAAMGILNIITYFRMTPEDGAASMAMSRGLLSLIAGYFCVFNADWFNELPKLPLIYGAAMLFLGVRKLGATVDQLRLHVKRWPLQLVGGAILSTAALVVLLMDLDVNVLWIVVASVLIAAGVLDLASYIAALFTKKEASTDIVPLE